MARLACIFERVVCVVEDGGMAWVLSLESRKLYNYTLLCNAEWLYKYLVQHADINFGVY